MISFVIGDLFQIRAEAIVNTVNCVGVQGAGVALGCKTRWPAAYAAYRKDCGLGLSCAGTPDQRFGPAPHQVAPPCCQPGGHCNIHRIRPGIVTTRWLKPGLPLRAILELPTKRHWKDASRIEDVVASLSALAETIRTICVGSVAMTMPGCGNGGLQPHIVRPFVEQLLGPLTDVDIRIVSASHRDLPIPAEPQHRRSGIQPAQP